MRPCRFYSSRKVPGVPRNPLKHLNGSKQGATLLVPSPSHIVHPFYTPSSTEEIIACSTESFPALLDGKQIVPSLVNDPAAAAYRIEMSSLKFKWVRGVSSWLEELSNITHSSSQVDYKILDERMTPFLSKPSKLSTREHPLISTLRQLFVVEESHKISPVTLNAIIEQFVNDRDLGVFSEDVYLYLLQNHVNSTEKILTIIESIRQHLSTDIDQLKVTEELVLNLLISLKKNKLPVTKPVVAAFDGLLEEINSRFHLQDCVTQFRPLVCGNILEHYIKVGNLSGSKRVISGLIARKVLPAEKTIVAYLKSVNEQLEHSKTHKGYLKAFALVSDFRPIIERAHNPLIFTYLIPLCRHISEVTSLLTTIKNSSNAKDILNVNLVPFIHKISHLKADTPVKSAHLCALYRMALPFYNHEPLDDHSKAFVLAFAELQNYTMMATVMGKYTHALTKDFFNAVLSKLEKSHVRPDSHYIEGCDAFKVEFLTRYMLPFYFGLSEKSKLHVIPHMKTKVTLSTVLEAELARSQSLQVEVLGKIFEHGISCGLLSDVPASVWDKITANSELNSALREATSKSDTTKVQSTDTI